MTLNVDVISTFTADASILGMVTHVCSNGGRHITLQNVCFTSYAVYLIQKDWTTSNSKVCPSKCKCIYLKECGAFNMFQNANSLSNCQYTKVQTVLRESKLVANNCRVISTKDIITDSAPCIVDANFYTTLQNIASITQSYFTISTVDIKS